MQRLWAQQSRGSTLTLDHLSSASVQGLVATDPRRGCRVLRLGGTGEDAEAAIMGKRCERCKVGARRLTGFSRQVSGRPLPNPACTFRYAPGSP